jgi:hypothetical protein
MTTLDNFKHLFQLSVKQGNRKGTISYDGWTGTFKRDKLFKGLYNITMQKGEETLQLGYDSAMKTILPFSSIGKNIEDAVNRPGFIGLCYPISR